MIKYKVHTTVSVHTKISHTKTNLLHLVKDKILTESQVSRLSKRQLEQYCTVVGAEGLADTIAASVDYKYKAPTIQRYLNKGYTEQDILDAIAYAD